MPLQLTITSFQRLSPGQETTKMLDHGSISIGRAAQNDWILQDPERILSGRHCTIHDQDGGYFLTDTSTNGVYFNDSEQRIGRNQMVRLNEGDRFVLGEYEIAVTLLFEDTTEATEMEPEGPITEAVPIEDLMPHPGPGEPDGVADSLIKPSFQDILAEDRDHFESHSGAREPDGVADSLIKPSFQNILAEDRDHFQPHSPPRKSGTAVATEPPPDLMEPDRAFFEPPSLIPETPPPATESAAVAAAAPEPVPTPLESEWVAEPATERPGPEARDQPDLDLPEPSPKTPPAGAAALIPDDWWSTPAPAVGQPAPPPPPDPPPRLEPLRPVPEPPAPPTRPEPPGMAAQPAGPGSDALIRALLQGAGLPHPQLTEDQWLEVMANIGAIFRETVQGLMEILLARGDVKGEFRLHRTTIGPIENNPLKTSPGQPPLSPEQAMTLLLIRQKDAYMSPVQAVRESFTDIKAHQLAVMAGIQAALNRLLERFDPGNLETRLEQSVFDNLWPGNRKAKYWDLFTTEYRTIAREAEDDFNELFGDEFARAYEERLRDH